MTVSGFSFPQDFYLCFIIHPVIIEALLRGVSEGQDILTMSLGGTDGWTEGSASVVSSRIASTGKIVTIAAGTFIATGTWMYITDGI